MRFVIIILSSIGVFLIFGVVYFFTAVSPLQAIPAAPPAPLLLSNLEQTEGDVGVMQRYNGHTLWTELNGSEGMDLFYSAPPFTQTVLLSDLTQTEGSANYMHTLMTQAKDGTPHVIWLEETGTSEKHDLFYWTPVSGTLRLTDRNLTEGNPELGQVLMDIQLDENDQAHVIWNENEVGDNAGTRLWFYWNQANNTTQVIPGFSNFTIQDATAHVVWRDYYDGSPHYWNSADQIDVAIPYTAGSVISGPDVFADNSGDIYVYWGETFTPECLRRWNAATQITETVVSGNDCLFVQELVQDKAGKIHAIGQRSIGNNSYEAYYWNSSLTNALIIQTPTTPSDKDLYVADNGVAHVQWIEGSYPNEMDMYHWDSATQTMTNLSAGVGSNTYVNSYSVRTLLTADGQFSIVWEEGGAYYFWRSGGAVENLETKFGMSDISFTLALRLDGQNNVHMAWHGTPTSGSEGLFFWDEITDTVQRVWTGPTEDNRLDYSVTPSGKNHLSWTAGNQVYYWNETLGQVNLTVNTVPDYESAYVYSDSLGNVSLWWREESSTAAEGTDLYAAWVPTDLNQHAYLPFIAR